MQGLRSKPRSIPPVKKAEASTCRADLCQGEKIQEAEASASQLWQDFARTSPKSRRNRLQYVHRRRTSSSNKGTRRSRIIHIDRRARANFFTSRTALTEAPLRGNDWPQKRTGTRNGDWSQHQYARYHAVPLQRSPPKVAGTMD